MIAVSANLLISRKNAFSCLSWCQVSGAGDSNKGSDLLIAESGGLCVRGSRGNEKEQLLTDFPVCGIELNFFDRDHEPDTSHPVSDQGEH